MQENERQPYEERHMQAGPVFSDHDSRRKKIDSPAERLREERNSDRTEETSRADLGERHGSRARGSGRA